MSNSAFGGKFAAEINPYLLCNPQLLIQHIENHKKSFIQLPNHSRFDAMILFVPSFIIFFIENTRKQMLASYC